MSITTENVTYFDDLNIPDQNGLTPLDKNYLRILFKPGVVVQTRELNQAQSILQAQLDRLGRSLYKANSAIIGGQCDIDNTLRWIDVNLPGDLDISILSNLSLTTSGDNISTAVITAIEEISGTSTHRIFIQDRSGTLKISSGSVSISDGLVTATLTIAAVGGAIGCTLENGIYFVKGCIATAQKQYVTKVVYNDAEVSSFIPQYTGVVTLKVEENYIDSDVDSTLNDNANGIINALAPGADRYSLKLTCELLDSIPNGENESYIKIAEITNGIISIRENSIDASGSTLEKILAQRTFEESGDYVVSDFDIEIQDVIGSDYTSRFSNVDQISDENVKNNSDEYYACTLSPSIAYVKGTRVDLQSPLTLFSKKARQSYLDVYNRFVSVFSNANVGNYIIGTIQSGSGLPLFDNVNAIYDCKQDNSVIGSCKISTVEKIDNNTLRVFLYDISLNSEKKFSDVTSITVTGTNAFNVVVQEIDGVKLNDTSLNNSLFGFSYNQLKTVKDLSVVEKVYLGPQVANSSGIVSFAQPGKAFDKSPSTIIVSQNGIIFNSFSVVNSAADILQLSGFSSGDNISVIASVTSNISSELGIKQKTTEIVTLTVEDSINKIYRCNNVFHAISVEDTSWTLIDDGQRPNEYINAKVKYIGSAVTPPSSVNITHWKFTNNGRYYTVNSYRSPQVDGNGGQVEISEIPSYNTIKLSDVIDTRLRQNSNDRLALDPYSVISAELDFYLPRKDVVCVYNDKTFSIINGVADINSVSPSVADNACALFELSVPAYTFSINDIVISRINNRRYTMRDIGSLEKRIGNLEYYTTLSLLEKNAADKSIFDENGERFKNGFIVDGFRNHSVGDINNPLYKCSVDKQRGRLYPYHSGYSLPFKIVGGNGTTIKNGSAFLNYNSIDFLSQNQASQFISLQPHEVVSSIGNLQLFPEVDTWSDQTTKPTQTIQLFPGLEETLRELGNSTGLLGTDWDSTWTTTNRTRVKLPRNQSRRGRRVETTTTQTNIGIDTAIVSDDISNSLGQYISDVNIRPYMRSRSVYCEASALKPNTRYYFYFDGIDVTSYARPTSIINFSGFDQTEDDGLNESALLAKYPSGNIVSDENGVVKAIFIIPNNESLKFSSGEKTLRITNSPRNIEEESTSIAESKFISNGLGVTRNETIVSTKVPRIRRETVTRTRQIVRRHDPIAQTFRVDDETGIFVTSVDLSFATKPIEANAVGVQVYIVSTKNGYPTSDIIPGSETFLPYSEINISEDSSLQTTFDFSQPLYLEGGNEYALVVFSESNEYNIYIAEMSGTSRDLQTKSLIVNQPALGVFFTSSNKTTWTAHQNRDLKFNLKRAQFAQNADIILNPVVGTHISDIDMSSFIGLNEATNSSWQLASTVFEVSDPDFSNGIRAEVSAIYDPNSLEITSFNIINSGFGYTTPPTVTVKTVVNGSITKQGTFNCILPNYKIGAFNLNQKSINISGKTQIGNQLTLETEVYNLEAGVPVESVINQDHSISYNNIDKTILRVTLNSTDIRLSPVIDLNSLTLQTREYYLSQDDETSTYFTKQIVLNNPSDRLDVWLDVNKPTETSNIQIYANFKDAKNETIGSEWQLLTPSLNNQVNSNRDVFTEVRYSVDPTIDFTSFILKIVFVGEYYNDVSSCRDLRVIATI